MSHEYSNNIDIEENLHVYYISFDLGDNGYQQAKDKFYNELFNDIPAFAFGPSILREKESQNSPVEVVREAFHNFYSIKELKDANTDYLNSKVTEDKYIKRGEFGELMLYHLLHEYFDADALISKIYFKDSNGAVAHGFDAVHLDPKNKIIWLGESKLYKDASNAISALADDVKNHFNSNFFTSEFQVISNRANDNKLPCDEFVSKLLDPNTKTLDKLANINICLFAGFENKHLKNNNYNDFKETIEQEIKELNTKLKKSISSHPWIEHMNIYLLTFPLDCKKDFVSSLHQKLKGAQQI